MAWYEDLYESAKEYLSDRYLGDKAVENIVKDVGSLGTAYTSYEDQKRANEAMERAYQDYTKDKETSQATIEGALALGLQPMPVSNIPTTKADITDYTEVQDVAKGGLMSLPNKQRKRYALGPDPNDLQTADEMSPPFDPKEEGISISPMVDLRNRASELMFKLSNGTITDQEIIELRNLESQGLFQLTKGPEDIPESEEVPNWFDLMREEGIPHSEQVQNNPQLVKPPWMTDDEWLNFQYRKTEAARGGIMKLRRGGRPGYADSNIEEFKEVKEERTYPSKHKFWELVDWEHYDKTSKDKEDSINRDMKLGISWDEIKKKYNLKDFEDVSITETEREETDSGSKVKKIFEKIKEKYNSIDFKQGGRIGYATKGIVDENIVTDFDEAPPDRGADIAVAIKEIAEQSASPETFPATDSDFAALAQLSDKPEHFPSTDYDFEVILRLAKETNFTTPEQSKEEIYANYMAHGGRIGYNRGLVVNPGGYSGEADHAAWLAQIHIYMANGMSEEDAIAQATDEFWPGKKGGGRIKKAPGGIMNLGGLEKDYRTTGGFVPIGAYEKKDDVPARLSKNEFVMTADAVRAAGGGSINRGAQQMYNVMKNLEARPSARRKIA